MHLSPPIATDAPGTASPRRSTSLAGPVACGCALVGAAVFVAVTDPTSPGSHLPPCPLHELTGLWCPACGLTRATHALLRGNLGAAFGYNALFPLLLGAIVLSWAAWLRASLGRSPMRWVSRISPWMLGATLGLAATFAVLRNLSPFAALAP